jgi:hypothetical protein
MAFRFVLFLVSHFFPWMSLLLFPLAFDLLASLRACPIAPIASCPFFSKISPFCLPLGAAPPQDIADGR